MTFRAIAYVSTALPGLHAADIDSLLLDARTRNKRAGVTGILLYDGTRFFQYLEGPQEGVDLIYKRINASRLHRHVEELHNYPIDHTYFTQWNMGCKVVDGSILQKLSTQQWQREAGQLSSEADSLESPALLDLVEFWNQLEH